MWDSRSISSNISMTNRAPTLLLFEHDLFSGRILNTKKRYHFLYLSARLICSHKTDGAVLVIFLFVIASDDVRTALPEQVVFMKCIKGSCATSKNFYVYLKAGTVASHSLLEEVEGKVHRQGGLPRTCLEVFFLFFCPIQDVYFKKTMVIATVIHSLSSSLVNLQKI